jgi:uncharacterized protein
MSSKNFEKMCQISERIIDNGTFNSVAFRLSGGEPLLVYENYKDIVTKYYQHNRNFSFGVLSNLTILTDDILKWLRKNNIGIQVSLDDLENSKPLANGQSSSKITMKNIKRLRQEGISFSINTVLDIEKTKSLKDMVEYVCLIPGITWGLNASYINTDERYIDETINVLKEAISELLKHNFDICSKLRLYNMILNNPFHCCSAGINIFAIGPKLEVWPCQSQIDKKPLGYFDENIKGLLEKSKNNEYFFNKTLLPSCTDCRILHWCRGGCRAAHLIDKATNVVCRIRKEVVTFALERTKRNYQHQDSCQHQSNCNSNSDYTKNEEFELSRGLDGIFKNYIEKMAKEDIKPMFVETPLLPELEKLNE